MCFIALYKRNIGAFKVSNEVVSLAIPIFIFAILLYSIFFLIKSFFWLTESEISARVKPLFTVEYSNQNLSKEKKLFKVFWNPGFDPDRFSWKGDSINFGLRNQETSESPGVSLFLYEGCAFTSTEKLVEMQSNPVIETESAKEFMFSIDDGNGFFTIYNQGSFKGVWSLIENETTTQQIVFEIAPDKGSDTFDAAIVSNKDYLVNHRDWNGDSYYRFDADLVVGGKSSKRFAKINIDGKEHFFLITPNEKIQLHEVMRCSPLHKGYGVMNSNAPHFVALLKVSYPIALTLNDLKNRHHIVVKGLAGAIQADNLAPNEIDKYFSEGRIGEINVKGLFEEIVIDNENIDLLNSNSLSISGGSTSARMQNGSLVLRGEI